MIEKFYFLYAIIRLSPTHSFTLTHIRRHFIIRLLVAVEGIGIIVESVKLAKVIFLLEDNRLSSRDSGNIGNNMGTFYHRRIYRTKGGEEGTLLRMALLITPVRSRRVSNFNRSLQPTRLCSSFT